MANCVQMMLAVFRGTERVATVYNKAEAAAKVRELGVRLQGVESALKAGFQNGGRVVVLGDLKVVKTNIPAPHRHKPGPKRSRRKAMPYQGWLGPARMFCGTGSPNNHGRRW